MEGQFSKATEALKKKLGTMVRSSMWEAFRSSTSVNDGQNRRAAPVAEDLPVHMACSPPTAELKPVQQRLHKAAKEPHWPRLYQLNPASAADLSSVLNLLQNRTVARLEDQ